MTGKTLKKIDSFNAGEQNAVWGFVQDAVIIGPTNATNAETVFGLSEMAVRNRTTIEERAIAKIQLPQQPNGAGAITKLEFMFSAWIQFTNTINEPVIFTNLPSPTKDTITKSTGNWGSDGIVDGCKIEVRNTTLNDGIYTVDSHTATVLTIVENLIQNEAILADIDIYAPPDRDLYITKGNFGPWLRVSASWDHRIQSSSGPVDGLAEWQPAPNGPDSEVIYGSNTEPYNDTYIGHFKASDMLAFHTILDTIVPANPQRSLLTITTQGDISWGDNFDIMLHIEDDSANQGKLELGTILPGGPYPSLYLMPTVAIYYEQDLNEGDVDFTKNGLGVSNSTVLGQEGYPIFNIELKDINNTRLLDNIFGFYDKNLINENLDIVGIDNVAIGDYILNNLITTGQENTPLRFDRDAGDGALGFNVFVRGTQYDGTVVSDTLVFPNTGTPLTLQSTTSFYRLNHIEIEPNPDIPTVGIKVFLPGPVPGALITQTPNNFAGVVFTNINEKISGAVNIREYSMSTETPTLPFQSDIQYMRVWQQTRGIANQLNTNPTTAVELDFTNYQNMLAATREIPTGTSSSVGLTGDTMHLDIIQQNLGTTPTHIDMSFFINADGERVYQRQLLDRVNGNTFDFIYTRTGTFKNEYRLVNPDLSFATPWVDYDSLLDVTINAPPPTAILEVYPKVTRVGKEISIDGRLSGTRAGNVTITDFSSRAWAQDFTNDSGQLPEALTSHTPATNPIRKHTYTKSELGNTYPKVVRLELQVTDSFGNPPDTDTMEIIVNDNVPVDLYNAMVSECPTISRITAIPESRERAFTKLKAFPDGTALVDQGDAGITATISGTVAGPDYGTFLEKMRAFQREQTFIKVPVFERFDDPNNPGLSRYLRGVITGNLSTPHSAQDRRIDWTTDMFVEDAIVADSNGFASVTLKCGDDMPGVGLLDMTLDDLVTPIPTGAVVQVLDATDIFAAPVATFNIGDGTGAGAGQFNVTISLQAGMEYILRVYDGPSTGSGAKYGDTAFFKPLRPGTINIRGISTTVVVP